MKKLLLLVIALSCFSCDMIDGEAPEIRLFPKGEMNIDSAGDVIEVQFGANKGWNIDIDVDWVTTEELFGDAVRNKKITLTVLENNETADRVGVVTFKCDTISEMITINQVGGEEPDNPDNPEEPSEDESFVVILSIDAFRWDLDDLYDVPTLDSIKSVGVFAEIRPCFPANTFPNHYSMATGLHPDKHGIVNNSFYAKDLRKLYNMTDDEAVKNPDFYKGEPIWNTVELQGLIAHVYTWVGVEAKINGRQPTVWLEYGSRTQTQLADLVLGALCQEDVESIPNLTMWYFNEPDKTSHAFSSNSTQTERVVEEIDDVLKYFMREVRKSPVYDKINFIFTSDHGMADTSPDRYYNVYDIVNESVANEGGVNIAYWNNSSPLTLDPKAGKTGEVYNTLKEHEEEGHYQVWMREDVPAQFHFGTNADRIYPIVVLPETGWRVVYNDDDFFTPKEGTGNHGYDPFHRDMHMSFYACGPAFKRGYVHDKIFQSLNDYLIICNILDIEPAPNDCVWEDIEGIFVK